MSSLINTKTGISGKALMLVAIAALALAGCGGGGNTYCDGDGCGPINPPTPPVTVASGDTFPVTQALVNVATQSYSYNVSAYDSFGNQFTVTYSSAPGTAGTFNGQAASTANVTETLYQNGFLVQTESFVNYYVLSPYQFLGSVGSFAGGDEVTTSFQTMPATGTVGQTFPELTANLYHDTTQTVQDGSLSETVVLAPNTASTAYLCFNDMTQLTQAGITDNLISGPTSNCFGIDVNGNVLGMQITMPINGVSMLFF